MVRFSDTVSEGEYFLVPTVRDQGNTAQLDGYYVSADKASLVVAVENGDVPYPFDGKIFYATSDDTSKPVYRM